MLSLGLAQTSAHVLHGRTCCRHARSAGPAFAALCPSALPATPQHMENGVQVTVSAVSTHRAIVDALLAVVQNEVGQLVVPFQGPLHGG